ncbi:phospholipase D-like domain-containing protein [Actinocatenispora comari]|uniref:phospholipase D n=1 Tax=Actinocatenispora comari TaxID=2807577 RepID=A0A8J4ABV9_9ACTN|nr:phospholipase D-like domain-containing protein [Actinocatenispora comari]GIL28108.1 hypothetical protein NUM_33620 [Actinocatenispora comari]
MRRRSCGVALVATALVAVAAGAVGATAASAATPEPVIGHAVFNDPAGSATAQDAVFTQLAGLIERVPAGQDIELTTYGFDVVAGAGAPDLAADLIAAYQRGVHVRVIVDHASAANAPVDTLRSALGSDDTASSYVVDCKDQFPDGPDRGCIGTRQYLWPGTSTPTNAYNHNKFALFSQVALASGTVSDVVYQASANIGSWDSQNAYNNAFTYTDPRTYGYYAQYFDDLRDYRHSSTGDNDYYRDSGTGTRYRVFFFPRHEPAGASFTDSSSDTVYNILRSVACTHTNPDGSTHQTLIRVANWALDRTDVAQQLDTLAQDGCWVDVVYSNVSTGADAALSSTRNLQVTKCDYSTDGRRIRLHSKYLLINGGITGDPGAHLWTGSPNLAWGELRQADEAMLRVLDQGSHDEYLADFWHVRDTCRANGGIVR